ncbi:MAG: hypothetical protein CO162_03045 [bacterium (Candidatus Ratteibacteria) CG_4_9_14_3_um_filter_41_21]|uniref:Uncharacterized protein n=1 Tax=bacterium (Candidatus Ratteibacteria) CG_4_9_14_3_um_filter_41_21 TaxID=2014289 RepID=A0A2M7YGF6_9BACT|nr:MAG: hypothetical protein CO162_03045 [bacterium (Candidatus Ratteibacteria) CG_4_9_14_3_um_filter_41_21]
MNKENAEKSAIKILLKIIIMMVEKLPYDLSTMRMLESKLRKIKKLLRQPKKSLSREIDAKLS